MDIAALSMNMHMMDIQNSVGIAMLSKSLDTLESTGEDMTKMLEASVTPELGQNIDVCV